ncbi:hypothetical protein [Nocardia sienata]|uniref:hypothetical protein n=1 Tax=Nocardia sienata TaxID=248552 RepID=UPI0007A3B6F8|nr:hypothetical protein [Nocardia sienata]
MIKVNPGELPAIGSAVSAQNSSLAAFLQSVAPHAVPLPSVAWAPGFYMTAGFGIVDAVLSSYLATGIVESDTGGASLGPISVTFATTDAAGSVGVSAVGGTVAASVLGD